MSRVNLKQLLEAGMHFGHQTRRWNPKMGKYIFGEKNGIYIIDLEQTVACFERACDFLTKIAAEGKCVLFVGTKKQAQGAVEEAAKHCGMSYVTQRWLGGMLTNFETIRKSVARIDYIEQMETDGTYALLTKKEVSHLRNEREKLIRNLAGVREMKKLPAAIVIVDPKKEEIALRESHKLGIPSVALIDTNCDPDLVTYLLPGNDDAIRSIKLTCDVLSEAILTGRVEFERGQAPAEAEESADEETPAEVASLKTSQEEVAKNNTEGGAEDVSSASARHPKKVM